MPAVRRAPPAGSCLPGRPRHHPVQQGHGHPLRPGWAPTSWRFTRMDAPRRGAGVPRVVGRERLRTGRRRVSGRPCGR
eukprot:9746449-Alexandrium_andersonii.AAC.1